MTLRFVPTAEEIRFTLFSMASHKSPGPDGFNPYFYKTYWHIVGQSVVEAVQYFFTHGHMLKELNHTFIALIPKIIGASKVDQFRPIALCNVILKITTKILAS